MSEQEKADALRAWLDREIGKLVLSLDNGTATVPLLSGLALARTLTPEQDVVLPGSWPRLRRRLERAAELVRSAPDAGQVTQFGLADGIIAAKMAAARIEGEA